MANNSAKSTDQDAIVRYLQGNTDSLSDTQLMMLERIDVADNLIREHGREKAAKMIMKRFTLGKVAAYRVINDAMAIYGSMAKLSKDYWRSASIDRLNMAINAILSEIKTEKKVDEDGNESTIYRLNDPKMLKALADLQAELRRTIGYDKPDDPDMPDWSRIGANPITITSDPSEIGAEPIPNVEQIIRQAFTPPDVEDIDFEEQP